MAVTLSDIKKMSTQAKMLVVFLLLLLIGYLDWFYFLSSAIEKKNTLTAEIADIQGKIKEKTKIADQINQYKKDVATLQETYKIALQKLPDQKEIPNLFHSVALAGKDAGVEFLLFEPKPSVPKTLEKQTPEESKATAKPSDQQNQKPPEASKVADDKKATVAEEPLYEEIPVEVSVLGTFPNILYFFDKVAKLPRIINISNISMGDRKDVKGRGEVITLSCTIKTYMFIEKKDKKSDNKSDNKAK
ncbi:MAG TPA: type 4a pilus biogenesis protein PilO [Smithella sp.]|nr:type 4a pilus biogenesis protein PilO [Smithella sp.]